MSTTPPSAGDPLEAIALFRYGVIGNLCGRSFGHGELRSELRRMAQQLWRPPGADRSVRFGASTIERWYYAWNLGGIEALRPKKRTDAGRGRALDETAR